MNPYNTNIVLNATVTYSGFTINYPTTITGNGANISSGIKINNNNVMVNNVNVTASSSLTSIPEGDAAMKHAYLIVSNKSGITITGGSDNRVIEY